MAQVQGGMSGRPPQVAPVDPLEELKALLQQSGVGASGANIDYASAAHNAYAPQYGYLDNAAGSARNQAASAGKDVGGLYASLVKDLQGQEAGIKQNFNTGVNSVNDAYNQTSGQVGAAFNNTNSNTAEILRRLGIEQAAPNTSQKSDEARSLIQGIMSANNLGSANAIRQGGQAAVNYNTQQVGASRMAGTEAQTGIQKQLTDFLNQIAMQRAQLGTQESQYANSLQSDAAKQQAASQGDMFDNMFKIKQFEYNMGKDAADYQLRSASQSGNEAKLDPLGQVQQLASQIYPNSQAAGNAVREITNAAMALNGAPADLGQFMSVIRSHLMDVNGRIGDEAQLQRLAALYMQQMG